MASYKSQYIPPRRVEDAVPTTRLPKRSITPTTSTSQLPTSSGYSKLQKRRPSRDEPAPSARALPTPTDRTREISTRQTSNTATSSSIQRPGFTSYRSASSSSRLPKLDVHVNINTRTPSLVSGSSASTIESPRSNVLRRKQPSVGITGSRHALMTRDDPMSSQEDTRSAEGTSGKFKDPFTESVFGISLPPSSNVLARSDPVFESLQHGLYDNVDPLDIYPVPTPQYALSATPSTRNADSPGAFSISSAATSMTSYSPATALSKPSYRVRQVSPLESRPPVRRQRAPEEPDSRTTHVLSTVRESSTSSSSASTVVADLGKTDLAKKRMPAVPQSHPLPGESSTRQARPRVQPVPELAHLADSSPVSLHARRPSRPSRDGTPELHGLRDPSPIIQSNMSNFPGHHRRTSSSDSKFGSLSVSRSRAAIPVKASSRNPSPIPVSSIPSTPSGLKRGTTPDDMRERDERRSSTMPGPATTVSTGKRFGLFSRRTKTDPAPQPSKVNSKLVRKGPAAGTGHEGYGRHASASRGRSSSSIGASVGRSASAGTTSESLTQTPSTRKSSMTSTTSGEMDEFFLNRLTPVILRGAGSSSELSRSPEPMNSSSSLDISTRALPMGNTSSVTAEPTNNKPRPKLLPSAMPNTMRNASPAHKPSRRPSESDDDTKRSFLPTLSSKRTSRIARPTEGVSSAPRSRSISKTRKDSASDEGSWLRTSKKAKAEKEKERPKASKWNFFSRAHGAPRVETPAAQELNTASPGPGSRSLAHYALVDAQSSLDMKDLEELMKEAAGNTDTESVFSDNDSMRKERMQSILLPPKPIMPAFSAPSRPASPKVVLRSDQSPQRYPAPTVNTDVQPEPESSPRHSQTGTIFDLSPPSSPVTRQHDQQGDVTEKQTPAPVTYEQASRAGRPEGVTSSGSGTSSSAPRPSRLPQVGRIPKVVSSRGKARGPSSRSFSRPFVADQPRPVALPRTSFDSIGPVVATAGPVEPFPVLQGLSALCSGSAIATISPFEESRQSEFFKFPPRKDSEVSYSSSSGVWSFAPVAGTAVIPPPEAPFSDDELWNEYDDLLDEVVSPGGTTRKAGLARREPSSLEPPVLHEKSSCVSFLSGTSEQERPVSSVHLRRSRLLAALYAHQSPTSSMALSDVINDYSDRKLSVVDSTTGRLSMPLSPSLSTVSAQRRSARTSLPASLQSTDRQSKAVIASRSETDRTATTTATRYRDTRLMDIAEAQAFGHASMADLRFAALMTSKWLSFGRVLFSPVHYQLKDLNEDRVLVIDGTGKDWSFYCALTYSDAAVYDLGPAPSSPPSKDRKSALPNHRHIRHSSLTHALPYPQNFFACVVLRFPSAQPSTTHNFLLSEAKRVLRPGGYLEFSVLDLDLVNMGNRARKAVRQLKMDIHRVDDTISLRNISDEIIAGLGRKRFVECKSCVVGVPVAGSLPAPNDVNHPMRKNSTASSRMRADSNLQPSALPKSEPSFSDLLNAPTPSETTDMGIADKVARVGRWWYSRCYESIILPDNDGPDAALSSDILKNSIWRDDNLIRECEELGTSFRMLIGYAQKPEVSLRRHVSV